MNKFTVIRSRPHRRLSAEKIADYYDLLDAKIVADIEKQKHPRSTIAVIKFEYIA